MSRFNSYFLMKEADVADYVREKMPNYFAPGAALQAKEIGDGNLNYVFRVRDEASRKSIIVKQAGVALRISAAMRISTDRNRIESEILLWQERHAPGLTPKLFSHDVVMCACLMEDLADYRLMRHALMDHQIFPRFADDISTYMVNTLLHSSDVVMEHKAKKALSKSFVNPELCEITEDLVFTEPYNDLARRNLVTPANADFVRRELYEDKALHLEVAKLKFEFMTNAQALIHGDLHTGSIFVKPDATRVFDPEFAFYGPMGYDVGNVVANLFFAWDNGHAAGKKEFRDWTLQCAEEVINLFKAKFMAAWRAEAQDPMAKADGFAEFYLEGVMADSAAAAGTELIRRTVGLAQVKDVTSIADPAKRLLAERANIICAKDFIKNRAAFSVGADFTRAFLKAVRAAEALAGDDGAA